MNRKLVSTVTGTWNRHGLLMEMIENVHAQSYRPLEMVIVSDGPDEALFHRVAALPPSDITIKFAELGFWSSGLFTDSISAAPFMVAQLLARGDYQITMSDDERFLDPDAISKLVENLELYESDFAYSKAEMTLLAEPGRRIVIGGNPPRMGHITQLFYRREMLDRGALFRTHVGNSTDWDACARMMQSHARWVFVPEVLVTHRADKVLMIGLFLGLLLRMISEVLPG